MRLYVGNLSRDVNEEDLRETFQTFGQVNEVSIVRDRFNNSPKGFAFVEMPDQSAARRAIDELRGSDLKGRSMDVNEARPRAERSPRGNSGWGGMGGDRSGRQSGSSRRFH